MSVQYNTYVMWGVVLPYHAFEGRYEEYEPYLDSAFEGVKHHKGICVLCDGMNGEYVAVGRVLAKTKVYEGFDGPPIELKRLTDIEQDLILDAIAGFTGCFSPVWVNGWVNDKLQFIVLTHYR